MRYLKNGIGKSLMIATFISLGLASCSDDDSSDATTGGTANLTVRMTDAPGDYDEVNIDIQDVQIKVEVLIQIVERSEYSMVLILHLLLRCFLFPIPISSG